MEGIPVGKGNFSVITPRKMNRSNEWHQEEERTQRRMWDRNLRDSCIYQRKEVKITSAGRCRWLQRQWNPTGKEAQEAVVLIKSDRPRRIQNVFCCRWRKILVKVVQFSVKKSKWIKDGVGKNENYGTKKAKSGHGSLESGYKGKQSSEKSFQRQPKTYVTQKKITLNKDYEKR